MRSSPQASSTGRDRTLRLIALTSILLVLGAGDIDRRDAAMAAARSDVAPRQNIVQPVTAEEMLRDMLTHD